MRANKKQNGITAQAIAGTYVVYLGWDIDTAKRKNLRGFAIQREDITEGEKYWLRGMKSFAATPLPPGGDASSLEQPFQTFQWGDYTAKENHKYRYTIVPMYGTPGALTQGGSLTIEIATEDLSKGTHAVYFNRGATASQEYARKFKNQKPKDVADPADDPAYAWLSRGLEEALIAFIGRAKDAKYSLNGAIYEFQWGHVLDALHAAKARGAKVQFVYDAIQNKEMNPVTPNEEAIALAKIKGLTTPFTDGKIMHNKFVVLSQNNKAVAVLLGSTNWTKNGIFGHLNCAHIVSDPKVAGAYLDYWNELHGDPGSAALKDFTGTATPTPDSPPPKGITAQFSPQRGAATLDAYGAMAGLAKRGLFMTFAFGMNDVFKTVYEQNDAVLRFALMEKEGNGAGLAQGKIDIARIRKLPNVLVAIGHNVVANSFDRWLREISSPVDKANVRWVHTKFMLVDPLGKDPIVITGSANFSKASTDTNEENMVIIRGDTRVADIYFGEFMRSFAHYAFREALAIHQQKGGDTEDWKPQDLDDGSDWIKRYTSGDGEMRRLYFSGQ
jgi:phosphatidylserine/phosphatidylglycerophosphate/cardiolipin synthase-like enzyme